MPWWNEWKKKKMEDGIADEAIEAAKKALASPATHAVYPTLTASMVSRLAPMLSKPPAMNVASMWDVQMLNPLYVVERNDLAEGGAESDESEAEGELAKMAGVDAVKRQINTSRRLQELHG